MTSSGHAHVRDFIAGLFLNKGDVDGLADSESLFLSGRLDSLEAVELLSFLEQSFGIDFAEIGWEIERVDSIDAIVSLVGDHRG